MATTMETPPWDEGTPQDRAGSLEPPSGAFSLDKLDGPGELDERVGRNDPLAELARAYVLAAKAPSTLRAYRSDWRDFENWCAGRGAVALPATPDTVALYLAARAESHRPATLGRRLTSITKKHETVGYATPATVKHLAVGETLKGIRRVHGTAQVGKAPLVTADIQKIVAHTTERLLELRDRALTLVGYCGALRRSEIAALWMTGLQRPDEGMVLTLRRSKTDQEGRGRQVAIPRGAHPDTCPVRALERWIQAAGIQEGAVFRAVDRHGNVRPGPLHPNSVGEILKRAVVRAGYEPEDYAGHSLRAGFCTQAARNRATAFDIMRQTGHKSVAIVSRYIREAELFLDSPASKLGL